MLCCIPWIYRGRHLWGKWTAQVKSKSPSNMRLRVNILLLLKVNVTFAGSKSDRSSARLLGTFWIGAHFEYVLTLGTTVAAETLETRRHIPPTPMAHCFEHNVFSTSFVLDVRSEMSLWLINSAIGHALGRLPELLRIQNRLYPHNKLSSS